jgi:hypothetical protein
MSYTIPPDTRSVGSGNPPLDINNISDVLTGMGAVYNVLNTTYSGGADPTGSADSTAAINAALAAAPLGGVVLLPPGTYKTTAPLVIPPQVTLRGSGSWHIDASTCEILPSSSFSGAAIILMYDQTTGGYSVASNSQCMSDLILNGSNLTGSIDGIQSQGFVHGVVIQDVQIYKAPAHGIACVSNSSGIAYSWRGTRVAANTCGTHGFSLSITDCTWIDLEAIGCSQNGFNLAGSPCNTHFTNCRAEYNQNGFALSGAWGTGTGSGGVMFTGCSTDGNVDNGVYLTATGTVPVVFNGLMCRRDGANGTSGGGSYAGVKATGSTLPTQINGLSVFPGIALTNGANSPEYGVAFTSSSAAITVSNAIIYAATTPWYDDGSNTNINRGPNVLEYTGTTSSASLATNGLQSSDKTLTFTEPGSAASTNLLSSYLCAPNQYAPGSQTPVSVSTTTLAAWDSGAICTNSFAAPPSGSVIVTASFQLLSATAAADVMFGLAATGNVSPVVGHTITCQIDTASVTQTMCLQFYVTGLTAGTSYQFDLLGAVTSSDTASIYAYGPTSTSLGSKGGPVVMTVQAV